MKKAIAQIAALCIAITVISTIAVYASSVNDDANPPILFFSEENNYILPVEVISSDNSQEIRKIYELQPNVDPSKIPIEEFKKDKLNYICTDVLRDVIIAQKRQLYSETVTLESKTKDMEAVFSMLPPKKEITTDDQYTGTLLLDLTTIKVESAGYGSRSSEHTVSRNYPNLSDADMNHIPKSITDNGKPLYLLNVEWQSDNTANIDGYEITDRYTANVIYGGTKTSSFVKGYTIKANYFGEVYKSDVDSIRYTVIFSAEKNSFNFLFLVIEDALNGYSAGDLEFEFMEEKISQAFSGLSLLKQKILMLIFIEGFSAKEVALLLNCPVEYVYKQKHFALKKLKKLLSVKESNN